MLQSVGFVHIMMLGDNMLQRLGEKFRHFMYGRYGNDTLNTVLLILGLVLAIASNFVQLYYFGVLSYIPLFWAIFRMYSRNISRRRQENQKFLQLFNRLKDRTHRYFACPKCRQKVRVPKGKGKISITCPKCHEKFTKKT